MDKQLRVEQSLFAKEVRVSNQGEMLDAAKMTLSLRKRMVLWNFKIVARGAGSSTLNRRRTRINVSPILKDKV